jgi:hypothetical protein
MISDDFSSLIRFEGAIYSYFKAQINRYRKQELIEPPARRDK